MDKTELQDRTRRFAMRAFKLVDRLPESVSGQVCARQLARSSSSVAANYRAACRARSKAEFAAKIGIVEEEADESAFWIDFVAEIGLLPQKQLNALADEASQLTRIMAASRITARSNRQ
jgi:four helix bundle protein